MSAKNVERLAVRPASAPPKPVATSRPPPGVATDWALVIEDEDGHRKNVALDRDSYSIGRDPTCDFCLRLHNVSRRHALLEREPDGSWALRDLGSRYGTFVNGKRIEGTRPINHHDMVQVGDFLLTLASDVAGALPDERALELPNKGETNDPMHDRPDRVRVFGSQVTASREVRLDCGPVFAGPEGCAIRAPDLPFGTPRLQFRPLISRYGDRDTSLDGRRPPVGPRYEVVDESDTPCLLVNMRPLKSKVLDDDDIIEFADHRVVDEDYAYRAQRTFALRYLRRGRSSWMHATPPPLREEWTPPNLPVDLPPERVEHRWVEIADRTPMSRPSRSHIAPASRPDPLPESTLPGSEDDTLPPDTSPDTRPGARVLSFTSEGAPASPRFNPSPTPSSRPTPLVPPSTEAGLSSGEIHRLLAKIEPDAPAMITAAATPVAPTAPGAALHHEDPPVARGPLASEPTLPSFGVDAVERTLPSLGGTDSEPTIPIPVPRSRASSRSGFPPLDSIVDDTEPTRPIYVPIDVDIQTDDERAPTAVFRPKTEPPAALSRSPSAPPRTAPSSGTLRAALPAVSAPPVRAGASYPPSAASHPPPPASSYPPPAASRPPPAASPSPQAASSPPPAAASAHPPPAASSHAPPAASSRPPPAASSTPPPAASPSNSPRAASPSERPRDAVAARPAPATTPPPAATPLYTAALPPAATATPAATPALTATAAPAATPASAAAPASAAKSAPAPAAKAAPATKPAATSSAREASDQRSPSSARTSTATERGAKWLADVRITSATTPDKTAMPFEGQAPASASWAEADPPIRDDDDPPARTLGAGRDRHAGGRSRSGSMMLVLGGVALGLAFAAFVRWGGGTSASTATPPPSSTVAALAPTATTPAQPAAPAKAPTTETARPPEPTPPATTVAATTPPATPTPATPPATPPATAPAAAAAGEKVAHTAVTKTRAGAPPKPRPAASAAHPPPAGNNEDDAADAELKRLLRCQKLGNCE